MWQKDESLQLYSADVQNEEADYFSPLNETGSQRSQDYSDYGRSEAARSWCCAFKFTHKVSVALNKGDVEEFGIKLFKIQATCNCNKEQTTLLFTWACNPL